MARCLGALCQAAGILGKSGLDLLLPPSCVSCGQPLTESADRLLLCAACRKAFSPERPATCRRCAATLSESAEDCPWCRRHGLRFDKTVALGVYQDPLRAAVLRTKRASGDRISSALGGFLAGRHADDLRKLEADIVVPVPMHWIRRLVAGTNNADLLAGVIARHLQLPCRPALSMRRNIKQQKNLRPDERFRNVRRAFGVRRGYALQGARVLLIDDVLTTGATCSAAAEVLKGAGAERVYVAVLARAEGV